MLKKAGNLSLPLSLKCPFSFPPKTTKKEKKIEGEEEEENDGKHPHPHSFISSLLILHVFELSKLG